MNKKSYTEPKIGQKEGFWRDFSSEINHLWFQTCLNGGGLQTPHFNVFDYKLGI